MYSGQLDKAIMSMSIDFVWQQIIMQGILIQVWLRIVSPKSSITTPSHLPL